VVSGVEVRTVETDPDRAAHIRWAFDTYATGDWTLRQLATELEIRGLTQRPTAKRAARPLSPKELGKVLHNPYYKGHGHLERRRVRRQPRLLRMWHVSADIKTAEALQLPTPALRNGHAETVVVPATEELTAFTGELSARANKVRPETPASWRKPASTPS
jgi:hypothetical protein